MRSYCRHSHVFSSLVLCLNLLFCDQAKADESHPQYLEAIQLARENQFSSAISLLEDLIGEFPNVDRYVYDYLTILNWAERDSEVVALARTLDMSKLPVYVLEAIAKSARNLREFAFAESLYREALAKMPSREQSLLGLAMTQADLGKGSLALETLSGIVQTETNKTAFLQTQAYIIRTQANTHFELLKVYDEILQADPENSEAIKGKIMSAHWIGASGPALELANNHAHLLSPAELVDIKRANLANEIRWSQLPILSPEERREKLQKVIDELQALLTNLQQQNLRHTRQADKIRADLMLACSYNGDAKTSIAWLEQIRDQLLLTDEHVLTALGNNQIAMRQPDAAAKTFAQVFERYPQNLDAKLGYYYALLDAEQPRAASTYIHELNQQTNAWLDSQRTKKNPQKLPIELAAAMDKAINNQHRQTQEHLLSLKNRAPENADILSEYGTLLYWRGWSKQAEPIFTYALSIEPNHINALAGAHNVAVELHNFHDARKLHEHMLTIEPQHPLAQKQSRYWRDSEKFEYRLSANRAISSGTQSEIADLNIEAFLFSPKFKPRWRGYARTLYSAADLPGAWTDYARIGVGIEYTPRELTATAEVNASPTQPAQPGIRTSALWRASDHFSFTGELDIATDHVPLRARQTHIWGWRVAASPVYRFDETRRIGATLQHMQYSDQNKRDSVYMYLQQRVLSQSRYLMDVRAGAYASQNADIAAAYFNPRRDASIELGVDNDWLTYRHYETSLHQKLSVSAGIYKQQGYAGKTIGSAAYEHQWNFGTTFNLGYGLRFGLPAYDGAYERTLQVFINLGGRF